MENNLIDIEKRLMNTLTSISANKTNSVNSHEYNLYYRLIKAGIMQKYVDLKSYNYLYKDIVTLYTEAEFCKLKSTSNEHKKIRRYFQSLFINNGLTEEKREAKVKEFKADLFALLTLSEKKAEVKK